MRASCQLTIPKGKKRLLMRGRWGARLYIDGKRVGELPFPLGRNDGHGDVPDLSSDLAPNIRGLFPVTAKRWSRGQVTASRTRSCWMSSWEVSSADPNWGSYRSAFASPGEDFVLLSPTKQVRLTDQEWLAFEEWHRRDLVRKNAERRRNRTSRSELTGNAVMRTWPIRSPRCRPRAFLVSSTSQWSTTISTASSWHVSKKRESSGAPDR